MILERCYTQRLSKIGVDARANLMYNARRLQRQMLCLTHQQLRPFH
jgi:hypothetical protein